VQGEVLSNLGGPSAHLGAAYLEAFDGVVGLATRGLLVSTSVAR
jgi:adenine/guanine phosphoribosyltransferase-like PRPP-binding protein